MLKSIRIKNYKSCGDIFIKDITNIGALIGKNGTGKTNILTAIKWASNLASSTNSVEWEDISSLGDKAEFLFDIEIDKQVYKYSLEVKFNSPIFLGVGNQEVDVSLNENLSLSYGDKSDQLIGRVGSKVIVKGWESPLALDENMPCLGSILKLLPKIEINVHLEKIVSFFSSVNYYPLDEIDGRGKKIEPAGFIKHSDYTRWLSRHKSSSDPGRSVAMRLLYMYLDAKEDFNEVKELLGPNGLGLLKDMTITSIDVPISKDVDQENKDTLEKFYFLQFAPSLGMNDKSTFNFYGLSFGTRRLMRIVVSLIYDKSTVFLIEQPEDGIHPGLLHKLIPLLRSYSDNAQFMVASHSPDVLNRLEPKEVQLVTMTEGVTFSRGLNGGELEVVCDYIKEEGAFSDFLESIQED